MCCHDFYIWEVFVLQATATWHRLVISWLRCHILRCAISLYDAKVRMYMMPPRALPPSLNIRGSMMLAIARPGEGEDMMGPSTRSWRASRTTS